MKWYISAFKKYADFNGRARRKEYWYFVLFNLFFVTIAIVLDNIFGIAAREVGFGPIYGLYSLIALIPGLAVVVRRLHDTGKSGWMILISFIPFIGGIWLLVLMTIDGDLNDNEYGTNPKTSETEGLISDELTNINNNILLVSIIWMLFSASFWAVIRGFFHEFYTTSFYAVWSSISDLIWGLIPLGLISLIKNKSTRYVLFIIAGILFFYKVIGIIRRVVFNL